MKKAALFLLFLVLFQNATPARAADSDDADVRGQTGLPLPRYASLRFGEINLRTGPGTRYPIDWVYIRQKLPVEITAEYDIWRRVRDWEGTEGWVQKSALTGKRTAIVTNMLRDLRREDDESSPIVAHLEPGSIGQLMSCGKEWCRLKFDGAKGYLRKGEFWGAYENETF